MTRTILFVDVVHRDYLGLVEQVAQRGYGVVFNGGPLENLARERGIDPIAWSDLATPQTQARARRESDRIALSLREAAASDAGRGVFGSNLGDFFPHTGPAFVQAVTDLAVQQVAAIEMLERLRCRTSLDAIVLGCDNSPVQRAIVLYARKRGIPTIQLAHAIFGHSHALARPAGELHTLYSDYIAVFGERAKRDVVAAGMPADQVLVTGAPHWDPLYRSETRVDREAACRSLGLDPARPVVLYCGGYADGSSAFYPAMARWLDDTFRAVVAACAEVGPDVQLVVRPHPHERSRHPIPVDLYNRLLERLQDWSHRLGHPIARFSQGHKIEAFRAADVAVAAASSSVIPELMILQTPVVGVPIFHEAGLLYDESDGVAIARTQTEVAREVAALLSDDARRKEMLERQQTMLADINVAVGGDASYRTATAIDEIARRRRADRHRVANQPRRPGKLKILFAAHDFFPYGKGGTERYTRDLAHALVRRGHEVRVLHPRPIFADVDRCELEEDEIDGLPVARLLIPAASYARPRLDFIKPVLASYLQNDSVDVVHAQHLMGLGVSFLETTRGLGLPLVFTANDFWPICEQVHLMHPSGTNCLGPETIDKCVHCSRARIGFAEEKIPAVFHLLADRHYSLKRSLPWIDLMICPSRFLMDAYQRHGFLARQTIHLPQGARLGDNGRRVPGTRDSTCGPTNSTAAPHSALPRPLSIAYLGHIARRKGLDLLIRAIKDLPADKFELHIHGINAEPRYLEECLAAVMPGHTVSYHGEYQREDMARILAGADLAVVPSRGENYPFVIREILHLGVPVVASNVAGIPEIVSDGKNGRLFRSEDAADLARVLRELMGDPARIDDLRRGIEPVKSIDQDAAEIESHYRSLLRERLVTLGPERPTDVNVVLVAPREPFPTLAHAEVGRMLVDGCTELGVPAQLQRNRVQPNATNLFIGFEWIEDVRPLAGIKKIALQLDPLWNGSRSGSSPLVEKLRRADEVWSYDESDVQWLKGQGIPARRIPDGFAGLGPKSPAVEPDLDVLFEGQPNERQEAVLATLRKFCEVTRFSGAFGEQRDALYARAKIILHLRPSESGPLDRARILYQIHRGALVVAEINDADDLAEAVCAGPYAEVAGICRKYLSRPADRAAKIAKAKAWLASRPISASLLDLFEESTLAVV